jgi:L-arabinose isomerase
VLGMLDLGERFRMLANAIDVVEPPEPLPRLPVASAVWRPAPDFTTAVGAWLEGGGPHHTVFSAALGAEVLADFAHIAGVELLVIDEQTTLRDFRNELRWNAASDWS